MKSGDRVEYAAHDVCAQADGSFVPVAAEEWRSGEVLDVQRQPKPIDALGRPCDVVVMVAPDDGAPPFSLNAKLVRLPVEGMPRGAGLGFRAWLTSLFSKKRS